MNAMRLVMLFSVLTCYASAQNPYFSNNFYTFHFKAQTNSIRITSQGKDTLVSGSSFYQELIDLQTGDTVKPNPYAATNTMVTENGEQLYKWVDATDYCLTEFNAYFNQSGAEIKISVTSTYKKDVQVIRDALIMKMTQPLKEVYRKNTVVDTSNFQSEYWLNKEGVRFGSGKKDISNLSYTWDFFAAAGRKGSEAHRKPGLCRRPSLPEFSAS